MCDMQGVERLACALSDPQIKEMDVVPMNPPDMTESVWHPLLVENGCLGIPIATIPAILETAWLQLQQCTNALPANRTLSQSNAQQISRLTQCIVALNPGHHTAWNWRKRALAQGYILADNELRLLDLLVTYKRNCKSELLWYHRRWVVDKLVMPKIVACDEEQLLSFWKSDADHCNKACTLYPRNYHCWVYRWWCLQRINAAATEMQYTGVDINRDELDMALAWIRNHPADYAAAHYFHILAERICTNSAQSSEIWLHELALSELARTRECLTSLYASYESIWNHRRWCVVVCARKDKDSARDAELAFLSEEQQLNGGDGGIMDLINKHRSWLVRELS